MLRVSQAQTLIVQNAEMAMTLEHNLPSLMAGLQMRIVASTDDDIPGWQSLQDTIQAPTSPDITPQQANLDDVALVFFTSGTTALPKGCVQAHRNLLSGVRAQIKINKMDSNIVVCAHM